MNEVVTSQRKGETSAVCNERRCPNVEALPGHPTCPPAEVIITITFGPLSSAVASCVFTFEAATGLPGEEGALLLLLLPTAAEVAEHVSSKLFEERRREGFGDVFRLDDDAVPLRSNCCNASSSPIISTSACDRCRRWGC